MSDLIGSVLPIGALEIPDGDGKVFLHTLCAIALDREIDHPSDLKREEAADKSKLRPVRTGKIQHNTRVWFDDQKKAQRTVEAFSEMGYDVVPEPGLTRLSSFTPEEMTVHLFSHFKLTRSSK